MSHFEIAPQKKKQAVGIAIVLIAVVIQQFAEFPTQNEFTTSFSNWMHVPMFAAITAAMLWLWPTTRIGLLITGLAIVACSTEALQFFTGRQPSLADLAKDALGTGLAIVFLRTRTMQSRLVGVVIVVVATLTVPSTYLVGYAHQKAIFPTLFEPQHVLSKILNHSSSKPRYTTDHNWTKYHDRQVLALQWNDERWPGLRISETIENWHDYDNFVFDAYNLETTPQPINISVRQIQKRGTTGRYITMQLQPGDNHISVDLAGLAYFYDGGPAQIQHLLIYTTMKHSGERILLGRVWLE